MGADGVAVRRLGPVEWAEFRALRLAALRADRLSFGSTLERELSYSEDRWRDWCRRGALDAYDATFVAVLGNGQWVGMAGVFRGDGCYQIWGMWVAPKVRGGGVGTALLGVVLDWAAQRAPGARVVLDVNPTQESAARLYRTHGFEFTGGEQSLGHDPPAVARRMERKRTVRR